MVAFRHEDEMTNEQRRAIESVTLTEEWTVHGHLPQYLVAATEGLPRSAQSRIIHRVMEEEPLQLLHLPSEELGTESRTQAYEISEDRRINVLAPAEQLPTWYIELGNQLDAHYDEEEFVELGLLPSSEVNRQVNETIETEFLRKKEEQLERYQQEMTALELGETTTYSRERREQDTEPIPVYRDIAKEIRSLYPDVILLDFELIADHMQHKNFRVSETDTVNVEETMDQVYEFLESLYRPTDRFTTYILFSEDVFEKLGFEPTAHLEDSLALLAEQNEFVNIVHIKPYRDTETWMEDEILPLFYKGS